MGFLSRKLAAADGNGSGGGVFCYVNSVFAPGLDEGVGGLWRVSGSFFFWLLWFFGVGFGGGGGWADGSWSAVFQDG